MKRLYQGPSRLINGGGCPWNCKRIGFGSTCREMALHNAAAWPLGSAVEGGRRLGQGRLHRSALSRPARWRTARARPPVEQTLA